MAVLATSLGLYSPPQTISVLKGVFDPDQGGLGSLRFDGPGNVITWDGSNGSGQLAKSGGYYIVTEVKDNFGKIDTWTTPLTVIRTEQGVDVEVYNSAGEVVWRRHASVASAGGMQVTGTRVVPGMAGGEAKVSYGSGPSDFLLWDGTAMDGTQVAGGSYLVKVTQKLGSGAKQTYSQGVVVIPSSANIFDAVQAAPNPARAGDSAVLVSFSGLEPGSAAWGEVYSLAGERVAGLQASGTGLAWSLKPESASGIYILNVTAQAPSGRRRSQRLKVSLIR